MHGPNSGPGGWGVNDIKDLEAAMHDFDQIYDEFYKKILRYLTGLVGTEEANDQTPLEYSVQSEEQNALNTP